MMLCMISKRIRLPEFHICVNYINIRSNTHMLLKNDPGLCTETVNGPVTYKGGDKRRNKLFYCSKHIYQVLRKCHLYIQVAFFTTKGHSGCLLCHCIMVDNILSIN